MSSTSVLPQSAAVPNPPQYDLFVVHAEADRAWVDGYLKHALGLNPGRVMTPRDFRLGASVVGEFERGVTSSRFTLLVLSPAFLTDRWAELGEGLVSFSSVDEGQNRLLALTLHPCQAPLRVRFRESLDCTDWNNWDDEAARLRRHLDAPEPTIEAIPCPFPGMVPFRKEDARFFHGRDAEIRQLLTLIRQHRFLAVIGSSGSGKSSLITAGLLSKLDDPRNFPRGAWRVLVMRPGATPIEELSRILDGVTEDAAGAISRTLAAQPPAERLLVVVDQFEELFSQVKEAPRRDGFIGHLKALRADPRCTVILTMRADFYGDLMNSALWPIDKSQLVEVAALRGESLRQAIVKPAEAVGVYLEEGLVERLLADAADEPGSLPMLQEALVLLWGTMSGRLLTRGSYDTLGHDGRSGLAVATATKADATLATLPPDQQRIARRIFLRLVQFGEGRPDTRRQLGIDDLRAETDDPAAFDELLQTLITARLLTPSPDEERGLRVDIAHEMLIVGWPASRDWVESRRETERIRRRLVAKAEEWVRLGRGESGLLDLAELTEADAWLFSPDAADLGIDADVRELAVTSHRVIESRKRRKQMWTRVAIGGLTTALIAISTVAYWGDLKRRDAEAQHLEAVAQKKTAHDLKIVADQQANEAITQKKAAELQAQIATSRQLAAISTSDRDKRLDRSLLLAVEALRTANTFEARDSLFKALHERPSLRTFLHIGDGSLSSMTFSPDGKIIAAGYEGGGDSRVVLWDVAGRKRLADEPPPVKEGSVTGVAISPDGKIIAAGYYDARGGGGVVLRDVAGRKRPADEPLPVKKGSVAGVAFSPDGKTIAAGYSGGGGSGGVELWDVAARKRLTDDALPVKEGGVKDVAFSPDGRTIAAGYVVFNRDGGYGGVVLWDVAGRKRLADEPLPVKEGRVSGVAFSPDGKIIVGGYNAAAADAAVSGRGGVVLWDVAARKRLTDEPLPVMDGSVAGVAFSPDGKTIAAGFYGGANRGGVMLWDVGARKRLADEPLPVKEGSVRGVAFSPDGKTIAAGYVVSNPREFYCGVVLWDVAGRMRLADDEPLPMKEGSVSSVALSPDGKIIAAGDDRIGGGVVLWDVAERKRLTDGALPVKEGVTDVAFSPDGKIIVVGFYGGGGSGGVDLWDVAERKRLTDDALRVKEGNVEDVAFSPDGKIIAAGYNSNFGGVVLWDVAARKRLADEPLPVREGHVKGVAFSPDGKIIAAGFYGNDTGGVVLWDVAARKRLTDGALPVKEGRVTGVAFSPDGKIIMGGYDNFDGGVVLWDVAARKRLTDEPLPVREGHVKGVAFSPDGKIIAAGYYDARGGGGVVLWDVAARKRLTDDALPVKEGGVTRVAFSPDGTTLAATYRVSAGGGGVMLCDVDPESWQRLAGRIANRNFTRDEWRRFFPDQPYRPTFPDLPIPTDETPKVSAVPTVSSR
jgi:WD40 repeat protein